MEVKQKVYNLLRWSERYTQTDMVYLTKGGFWLTLSTLVSSLSGLLLAVTFANLLPKETYGTYRYVLSLGSILAIPTLSGMNTAVVQAVARGYEGSFIPALKARLRWGTLSSLASLALAGYYFLNQNLTLTFSFLIAATFLPLMNSFTIYPALWKGKKRFDVQTKYQIGSQILSASSLVAALLLTKNIFTILLVYFLSSTLIHFIFLQLTLKKAQLNKAQDLQTIPYGKHLSIMEVIGIVATHIDKILLWHFLGAVSVAIYSFAILAPYEIIDLFSPLATLAMPKFSQQDKGILKKSIPKKILKSFLITVPVTLAYIISAPLIYKIFFPQYIESVIYSQIVALLILFQGARILGTYFNAQRKIKQLYIANTVLPITKILLILIMLPLWGILGVVIALLCNQLIYIALYMILLKKS